MDSVLASDTNRDVVIYVNDFYPEIPPAFNKLSQKLERPLRGIMLIDAERKASGKYRPDTERFFEEIIVDFSDDVAMRKTIQSLEDRLLMVSCESEQSQLYFKKVLPYVPYVNTPTESSLDFCTDKGKMREMLRSYDSSISPKSIVLSQLTEEGILMICSELAFPLIIKPTNLAASLLVNKVVDENELRKELQDSFTALNEIYANHRGMGNKTLVVEEFVEGDLYSTDVYVDAIGNVYVLPFIQFQNGVMAGIGGYQEYQRQTFLGLNDDEIEQGRKFAENAVHAVCLRSCVAHIELFRTKNGWKIVELGARPGGWRQEMYALSYGIDHAYNEFLVKVGLEPEMPENLITHSAMFCINAHKVGIVDSIDGLEEARKHEGMIELRVDVKLGDRVMPGSQGGDLLIEGLMKGEDPEKLRRDIAGTRASITVNINHDKETQHA